MFNGGELNYSWFNVFLSFVVVCFCCCNISFTWIIFSEKRSLCSGYSKQTKDPGSRRGKQKAVETEKNIFSWSQFISTKDDAGDWEHEENVVIVAIAQDPYSVAGSGSSGSSGPGGPRWKNSWLTFFHLFDLLQSPSPVFTIFILPICHQTSAAARNLKPRSKFEMLQKIWKMQFCNLILNIRTCQTKAVFMVHFFKTTYD